jgi:hypothetical protein
MSSQRALTDYDEPEPVAGQDTADRSAWTPRAIPQCVCGTRVDAEAARVVGVDGVVPACPACWVDRQTKARIRTVTKAVHYFWRPQGRRRDEVEVDASAHPEVDG